MVNQSSNYVVLARYEAGSNTIRKVPENYCLIAFDKDDQPKFDVDAATIPYRDLVVTAYDKWRAVGNKSKIRLAAAISIALKDYRPFVNYPSWDSSDVFNAVRQLSQRGFSAVTELEHLYRDLSVAEWEAKRSQTEEESAEITAKLNDHVALIYDKYQSTFPRNEAFELEINVFVPIYEDYVQKKAEIFVGPHSREEAEAAFLDHTGVAYAVYEQSNDRDELLRESDTVGSYIERRGISNALHIELYRGTVSVSSNPLGVPYVIEDKDTRIMQH
ncbi:hypothetical protein [Paenibacillus taichungensis]